MPNFTTNNSEETQKIAYEFARSLNPGSIVLLRGDLGYGKTTFVQGLAKGLGIEKRIISPTFVIVRKYAIKRRTDSGQSQNDVILGTQSEAWRTPESKFFYHIDLYRITSERDLQGMGLEEILNDQNSIIVIEWPEKLGKLLPQQYIDITFDYIDEHKRRIAIE